MAKVLKVIDPFLRLDYGDTFELNENGDYVSSVKEDFTSVEDDGKEFTTKYHADFTISKEYAERMIEEGYLEPADKKASFVNIFDEIDQLLEKYNDELGNQDSWDKMPECLKVEKTAVLTNIVTVLEHLKSLKKN